MSTVQTARQPHGRKTRLATGLIALSALVAIAVSILFLALTGAHQTATPTSAPAHPEIAPAAVATPPYGGYFRDPTTHALLRVGAEGCNAAQLRVEKSCARP